MAKWRESVCQCDTCRLRCVPCDVSKWPSGGGRRHKRPLTVDTLSSSLCRMVTMFVSAVCTWHVARCTYHNAPTPSHDATPSLRRQILSHYTDAPSCDGARRGTGCRATGQHWAAARRGGVYKVGGSPCGGRMDSVRWAVGRCMHANGAGFTAHNKSYQTLACKVGAWDGAIWTMEDVSLWGDTLGEGGGACVKVMQRAVRRLVFRQKFTMFRTTAAHCTDYAMAVPYCCV